MKNKLTILVIFLTFLFTAISVTSVIGKDNFRNNFQNKAVNLKVIPSKDNFWLGEIVSLKFDFTNNSDETVGVQNCLNIEDGNLEILISRDDKTFYKYSHSGWGVADIKRQYVPLKANESMETSTNILWNFVPNVSSREYLLKTNLGTDYAFQTEGTYSIKAKCNVYSPKQIYSVESKPIKVKINVPQGEDLEVWNKIKDNGEIGYFIQEGEFLVSNRKPEERMKSQKEVEQIVQQYPNSFITKQMKQILDIMNKNEAKLKKN